MESEPNKVVAQENKGVESKKAGGETSAKDAGFLSRSVLIGVAGASASGKTTLCNTIAARLGSENCTIFPMDSFYIPVDKSLIDPKDYNWDHPNALDFENMYKCLYSVLSGKKTEIPVYNFSTHSTESFTETINPAPVIFLEGIFALYNEEIRNLMNFKIFIQTDSDTCYARRILRDMASRGRSLESVMLQYHRFVKPAFDEFIGKTMKYADIIVPNGSENKQAIEFIRTNLMQKISAKSVPNQVMTGESLANSWIVTKNEGLIKSDQIIFCPSEPIKNEFLKLFDLFSHEFSIELYQMIIKRYFKGAVRLLASEMYSKKIKYEDMEIYQVLDATEEEFKSHKFEKPYLAFHVVFLYEKYTKILLERLTYLMKSHPKVQVYILNAFTNLNFLSRVAEVNPNIHVINVLLIHDVAKFEDLLQTKCLKRGINLLTESKYRSKLHRQGQKYLEKRLAKLQNQYQG